MHAVGTLANIWRFKLRKKKLYTVTFLAYPPSKNAIIFSPFIFQRKWLLFTNFCENYITRNFVLFAFFVCTNTADARICDMISRITKQYYLTAFERQCPIHALKAQRGRGGIAPLSLSLRLGHEWQLLASAAPLPGKDPVRIDMDVIACRTLKYFGVIDLWKLSMP